MRVVRGFGRFGGFGGFGARPDDNQFRSPGRVFDWKAYQEMKAAPKERLRFHQAESGPLMADLEKWMARQFEEREVESLFRVIGRLRAEGVAILYVSHRLEEIARIADRCSVMRDGRVVAEMRRGAFSVDDLVRPGGRAAARDGGG